MSPPLELRVGADARTDDLRLVLGPAGGVSGRVVDAAGLPVPGAPLLGSRPGWADGPQVSSDHTGRFRFDRLPPGTVELQLLGLKSTPRVARRRGVVATRCDPVRAEVTEVVVRIVDDPGGR